MKFTKRKILYLLLPLIILLTFAMSSCSSEADNATEIISAEISNNKKNIVVKATLSEEYLSANADKRIYLLAIDSIITDRLDSFTIADNSKAKSNLTFKISLTDAPLTYISSAFVLAEFILDESGAGTYKAITDPVYVQNPGSFSTNARRPISVSGIKGIATNDIYEAEYLGTGHVLLEASMDKLLLSRYEDGAVNYLYESRTYYFDRNEVEKLDKQIKDANALGLRVYLRTTLSYPEKSKGGDYEKAPISELYCPGAAYGEKGYLPNMQNSSAAGYVKAFYSFLANRYDNKDRLVLDYIIGKNVNDFTKYCNPGNYSREIFEKSYLSWVRAAYNILGSRSKNVQVYVSVNNIWHTEDTKNSIGAKIFLGKLAEMSDASKDFPWQIAMSLGQGEDLSSVLSGNSADYSRVGTGNFSEIFEYAKQGSMLYASKSRSVIIDSLSLPNTISEKNRASYYAYTFYKAAEAGFGAVIYSSTEPDCGLCNSYGTRSDLYYVFLMCESNKTSQLQDYTEKISDPKMPDFSKYISRHLTYQQEADTEISASILRNRREIPIKLTDFVPCGNTENAEFGKIRVQDKEQLTLTYIGCPGQNISAVTCFDVPAADIIESGYLGITLSSPDTSAIALIISAPMAKDSKSDVYICETSITELPETYYFNIAPFAKDARSSASLNISICAIPKSDSNKTSVIVSDIALYGTSGSGTKTVATVIVIIISTLAICGLLFLLTRRRSRIISTKSKE